MIVAIATSEFVILAADRRLTFKDGSLADDSANKLVQFADIAAFGYTGIAGMSGVRTDDWLAEQLAKEAPNGLMAMLRHTRLHAASYVGSANPRVPLAFLAGLWARPEGEDAVRPILLCISNIHEDWDHLHEPGHAFVGLHRVLPASGEPLVVTVGAPLDDRTIAAVRRLVRRRVARVEEPNAPILAGELEAIAVDSIRQAARRNARVGSGVLTACLPRPIGDGSTLFVIASAPTATSPTFRYYSPGDDPTVYGPTVVTRGGSIVAGFKAGPNRDEGTWERG